MNRLCLTSIVAVAALATPLAHAAQLVYPSKGQNQATQSKDQTECSVWAMQQTGYDPAKPAPAPAPVAAPAPAPAPVVAAATPASAGVSRSNTDALLAALGGSGGASNLLSQAGALTKGLGGQGTNAAVTGLTGNSTLGTAASLLGAYMASRPAAQPAAQPVVQPVAATPAVAAAAPAPAPDADFLRARALCLSARGYAVQ